MLEGSMCLILKDGKVLMILNTRGENKDRWNFPGGHSESTETPEQCVLREVFEETGLRLKDHKHLGVIRFFNQNKPESNWKVHIFVAKQISGRLRESDEGRLNWFDQVNLPINLMWPADKIWVPEALSGEFRGADIYYNEDGTELLKYEPIKTAR